jgi:hypothetical protein
MTTQRKRLISYITSRKFYKTLVFMTTLGTKLNYVTPEAYSIKFIGKNLLTLSKVIPLCTAEKIFTALNSLVYIKSE